MRMVYAAVVDAKNVRSGPKALEGECSRTWQFEGWL